MIRVAFYKAEGDAVDKLIRLATGSIYSHAELLGDRQGDGWECISASKRDGSAVRCKAIQLKPGHWHVVEIPGDADAAWSRAAHHLGASYDQVGAVLSVAAPWFGRYWRRKVGPLRFCSELIAEAVELPDPWSFHPGELFTALRSRGTLTEI